MKITFLGTSHGVPAADRFCSCSMLEVNGSVYFIDAGAPLMDILLRRKVELETIRAIFTTHFHGDHVNGLLAYADLVNWYFKTVQTDIFLTEEKGAEALKNLITITENRPIDEERLRFRLVSPGLVYEDENLRITAMPTQHLAAQGRPAYSYLVEAEGKQVLFSGDLSVRLEREDFPAYALEHPVDLMISEMAHFNPEHVLPYLRRCQAKRLEFNHVWPLHKLDAIREMDGQFGYPIHAVNDGDEIEL